VLVFSSSFNLLSKKNVPVGIKAAINAAANHFIDLLRSVLYSQASNRNAFSNTGFAKP